MTEPELLVFAQKIAKKLEKGDILALTGDLGSGKSTFAKYLLQSLFANSLLSFTSPTFSVIHDYETAAHIDLYRIQDEKELTFRGIKDTVWSDKIVLIEWPELWEDFFSQICKKKRVWKISFTLIDEKTRNIDWIEPESL
jgi:tRNA threonylcarbamoyl adenosine modification protein YjeE